MKDTRIRKVTMAIGGTSLAIMATLGYSAYCLWENQDGYRVTALREIEERAQPVWAEMIRVYPQHQPAASTPVPEKADLAAMRKLFDHRHVRKVFHVSPDQRMTWVTRDGQIDSVDMTGPLYRAPVVGEARARLDRATRMKLNFVTIVKDAGVRRGLTIPVFRRTWSEFFIKGDKAHGYLGYTFDDEGFQANEGMAVLTKFGMAESLRWNTYTYEVGAGLKPHMELPQTMTRTSLSASDLALGLAAIDLNQRLFWGLCLLTFAVVGGVGETVRQIKALLTEREVALAQSNFVSAVSHEMRTPLTTIKMYAEMMEHGIIGDPDKQLAYLQTIGHESDRLARLVENVLGYARANRGNLVLAPETLEVAAVIDEAVVAARGALDQAGVEVQTDLPPGLRVTADRDTLVQIFVNLLTNAAKYAADGKLVFVRGVEEGGEVVLTVKDFGPGIPAGEQKKVFQPFYRMGSELTRTSQGTGLGLALVDEYMKAQGGVVALESLPGQGATFRLVFPLEGRVA